jgi:SAM-dependent methyltransferase
MQNAIFNLLKLKNISPDISMSKRRRYLDAFLWSTRFEGAVLDIGGRKGVTRGKFRPPQDQVTRWDYVNIVPEANPDYLASAEMLPIADASYDCALMSEVLEHLEEPEKALKEAARVLKSGGQSFYCRHFSILSTRIQQTISAGCRTNTRTFYLGLASLTSL